MAHDERFDTRDATGNPSATPPFSRCIHNINLPADTVVPIYWPKDYFFYLINAVDDFWGSMSPNVRIPAFGDPDITDGSGSVLNPASRKRNSEEDKVFYLRSATDQVVSIEYYKRVA